MESNALQRLSVCVCAGSLISSCQYLSWSVCSGLWEIVWSAWLSAWRVELRLQISKSVRVINIQTDENTSYGGMLCLLTSSIKTYWLMRMHACPQKHKKRGSERSKVILITCSRNRMIRQVWHKYIYVHRHTQIRSIGDYHFTHRTAYTHKHWDWSIDFDTFHKLCLLTLII